MTNERIALAQLLEKGSERLIVTDRAHFGDRDRRDRDRDRHGSRRWVARV